MQLLVEIDGYAHHVDRFTQPSPPIPLDELVEVTRGGRSWQIGTPADVAWIVSGTSIGRTITAAIPPVFAAYATFHELDESLIAAQERAVVAPGQLVR